MEFVWLCLDNSVIYTNWGITSNELEPKTSDGCVQMCAGVSECGGGETGLGTWKTVSCSTSLDYICEVPCKIICFEVFCILSGFI